jgi:hypothetical protein
VRKGARRFPGAVSRSGGGCAHGLPCCTKRSQIQGPAATPNITRAFSVVFAVPISAVFAVVAFSRSRCLRNCLGPTPLVTFVFFAIPPVPLSATPASPGGAPTWVGGPQIHFRGPLRALVASRRSPGTTPEGRSFRKPWQATKFGITAAQASARLRLRPNPEIRAGSGSVNIVHCSHN